MDSIERLQLYIVVAESFLLIILTRGLGVLRMSLLRLSTSLGSERDRQSLAVMERG